MDPEITLDQRPQLAVHDPENGEVIVKAGQRINKRLLTKLQKAGVEKIPCTFNELKERILARSVLNADGEVIARCNTPLSSDLLMTLIEHRVGEVELLSISPRNIGPSFRDTLEMDKVNSPEQAMIEVYKNETGGSSDPGSSEDDAAEFLFNQERYSLSKVGRLKINKKLGLDYPLDHLT